MSFAARINSSFTSRTRRRAWRRSLSAVGVFAAVGLLVVGCSEQQLPTEVKSPASLRLNTSLGDGPTISTDKVDYLPGETVSIIGGDWNAGESVTLQVIRTEEGADNTLAQYQPWSVTADVNGNVSSSWEVTEAEVGATMKLTADGQSSSAHAEVIFTDLTGGATIRLYSDSPPTVQQTAFAWGRTVYPQITSGNTGRCYSMQVFTPNGNPFGSAIGFKPTAATYNSPSFTIPAAGPSGTWWLVVGEAVPNADGTCTGLTFGSPTARIFFDVARVVVIGAGTSGSDATFGDKCVFVTNPPTGGCAATTATFWVRAGADYARAYFHFDISGAGIPAGAGISDAKVRLHVAGTAAAARTYNIHRVAGAWDEGTLVAAAQPAVVVGATSSTAMRTTAQGLDSAQGTNAQTYLRWGVTPDVAAYVGGTTNNGWVLIDAAENTGTTTGRFSSTEATCTTAAGSTCTQPWPVLLIDYTEPPKLVFTTTAKTGVVGACLGPIRVQSREFDGTTPLVVTSDKTVDLTTANLGVGDVFGTAGAGSFFSNAACTTGATSTTIQNGQSTSNDFYYRATDRGDGGHDVVASATGYTPDPSQTQTINKAITVTTYDGDVIVIPGSTFTAKAIITSTYDKCAYDGRSGGSTPYNRRVLFVFDVDPTDGSGTLSSGFKFTNSSGVATATWATTGWIEGMYDLTVNAVDNDNCTAQKAVPDPVIAVLSPGNAATGGGFLAGGKVGGGRVNFGFNVRPIEGSDPVAYKGHLLLIRQDGGVPTFRCKGNITFYGVVSGSTPLRNFATGTCDFQVWNASLNGGEGGWEVPYGAGYTNRPFTIEFIDNGSGKGKTAPPPDEFGFSISFVGSIADPSFARGTLNGGNIDVKTGGNTTTTTDGGSTGGTGGRGKK